jgi:pantothenate kinase type III
MINTPMLLVDAGNSCVKWQVFNTPNDQPMQRIENARATVEHLAALWQPCVVQNLSMAWLSVGPPEVQQAIVAAYQQITDQTAPPPYQAGPAVFLKNKISQINQTIFNDYRQPSQLGADRWVSAIGWAAGHDIKHDSKPAQNKVGQRYFLISAGTATTIDLLNLRSKGEIIFEGGWILPGANLMHQSLVQETRDLRYPFHATSPGFDAVPKDSATAIAQGIGLAQAGFILHLAKRWGVHEITLHGGNAGAWKAVLSELSKGQGTALAVAEEPELTMLGLKAIATGAAIAPPPLVK